VDVSPFNPPRFFPSLGVTRLRGAEIAASIAKTPVVLRFTAKGVDVVVEVGFESLENLLLYQIRKRMQRERRLPFPAMSLAIWPDTAGQFGDALAITGSC